MSTGMLQFLDAAFSVLHTFFILFVLIGWLWNPLLRLHLAALLLTGFSWFVLGLRYGIGYCPSTEWHWRVKYRLGEYDLPHSYIEYLFRGMGVRIDADTADALTATVFFGVSALSVLKYLRTRGRKS
jgi:hypothetical protein